MWAKPSLVMGRGHYHWQHEPCWYAVRGTGHWNGDRKQSTLWHIENRNQDAETIHSTVDVAVTRWQNFTGKQAVLEGDGRTFDELAQERRNE